MQLINIADLTDPKTGKSYREGNLSLSHSIPLGKLVEIIADDPDDDDAGVRLYVVGHTRDCDGTPLYQLGMKNAELWSDTPHFYSARTFGGYSEESLKVIDLAQHIVPQ